MDADRSGKDRQWQRLAARWRTEEQKLRAPRDVMKRALRQTASRPRGLARTGRRLATPLVATAVLVLAYVYWPVPDPEPAPGTVAPVPVVHPSTSDPWIPAEPCAESSSCLDVHAELAGLHVPYPRGS